MHLHCIYASTSGHTEYVVQALREHLQDSKIPRLQDSKMDITMVRVEEAQPEDFSKGDVLLLASGTWNTGGREGQLNPHMHEFLLKRAKEASLKGRKVACIGLGDSRYRYTANAAWHLEQFVKSHGGELLLPTLRIVNEPYGQEGKVRKWGIQLLKELAKLPLVSNAQI